MEGEAHVLADMFGKRPPARQTTAVPSPQPPSHGASNPQGWTRQLLAFGIAAIVGGGAILGGLAVADRLMTAVWPDGDPNPALAEALFTLTIFGPILAAGLIGGAAMRSAGLRAGVVGEAGRGLAYGLIGFGMAAAYAWIAAGVEAGEPAAGPAWALALGTLMILLQTTSEEVLFRGWLQPVLGERLPGWAAILAAAALFAALHLLGGVRTPLSVLNLFLGGVLFGLLAWRSDGLLAPIGAHFAWNWTETILLGLDPNPGVSGYGAVWNLELSGPALWGGTEEGLNGGVGMTLALLVLVLTLAKLPARRS